MSIRSFLNLVVIRSKVASMTPFLLGSVYALYRYDSFRTDNFLIMLISLLSFDMATTAINNYYDYKKAKDIHGNDYRVKNVIEKDKLKLTTVKAIIVILVLIAMTFGVLLTIKTNITVLLIGMISFLVGIFYTFGPIPLSRMPLGEIFSGFFMGFVILFLAMYIHVYDLNIVTIGFENNILNLNIDTIEVLIIFLISIPTMGGIANIMLANNICDLDEDIAVKRFTLPYYIGKENGIKLFNWIYYIGYIDIILLIILRISPLTTLLVLPTIILINRNLKEFSRRQIKEKTFVIATKNFVIINVPIILLVFIGLLFEY